MHPTGDAGTTPSPDVPGAGRAFRLFGVPIRLHFTFVLFVIFLVVLGFGGSQSGLANAVYLFVLFGCVLLHELGHALVARRYGIRTAEIVMFPIGGVSRLERQPQPKEEFWIALAGPLVNLLIAGGLYAFLTWQQRPVNPENISPPTDENLALRVLFGNLILAGFNLLPAFPMDGGRVLRALLARHRGPDEATRAAAVAGRMLAIAMGLYGLLAGNFLLVFVAFFVYLGAAQEGAAAVGRILTHGIPVRLAMVTDFRTLPHGSTIGDAANLLLATSQQDFPVVHADEVIGLLGRSALVRGMAVEGVQAYVSSVMSRDFVRLSPDMDLAEALPLVAQAGSCALVMEEGRLLGLLTSENLTEFLLLRRVGLQPAMLHS